MGTLTIQRKVAATPRQVWDVITDWASYARWMPLTTMSLDQGPTRVGWSFAGRTGVGRLRFSDAMRITGWTPPSDGGPGEFRLVKVGRWLAGWAEVSVLPIAGGDQTRLTWRENIVIRPLALGRLLAPISDRVNEALFASVIDEMAAEAMAAPGNPDSAQTDSGQPDSGQPDSGQPDSGQPGSGRL